MAGKYAKKRKFSHHWCWLGLLVLLCLALIFPIGDEVMGKLRLNRMLDAQVPEWVELQLIPVDGTSRSGRPLEGIRDVVIHYVANPGTTAQQNHDYYDNPDCSVSSHFLVGLEGEVIQCVPLGERSAASNSRNGDTVSIEVCHPDETGKFNQESYASLVRLTAWLLDAGGLRNGHVIRHYDITGKNCPKYFVEHPESWQSFLEDVAKAREAGL